ncbi:ribosome-associated translation inhibitor RaiA [Rhodococcus sp. X156]|uniref:ribosome hibernation-promoting factor, HPF/YfiA family n=1 Tax=Rhodococcus sp. X156 TaxID=2499145 RepID=UPI000FD6BA4B|nr:ribosome-associated translation inhibitor RaiA [Rhodococcus sp. X156]
MTSKQSTVQTQDDRKEGIAEQRKPSSEDARPFVIDEPVDEVPDAAGQPVARLDIEGRNVSVPDYFRTFVGEKLAKLERFDNTIDLFRVELQHAPNPRQAKSCQRVELTAVGKHPVVRAEASAETFRDALENAINKLESRLRRAHDRRTVHHGRKARLSVADATAGLVPEAEPHVAEPEVDTEGPGRIVRTKEHPAVPMTVDEALYEMELVGHDFFLFQCADTGRPSVVYRRHAFDYGLLRLV